MSQTRELALGLVTRGHAVEVVTTSLAGLDRRPRPTTTTNLGRRRDRPLPRHADPLPLDGRHADHPPAARRARPARRGARLRLPRLCRHALCPLGEPTGDPVRLRGARHGPADASQGRAQTSRRPDRLPAGRPRRSALRRRVEPRAGRLSRRRSRAVANRDPPDRIPAAAAADRPAGPAPTTRRRRRDSADRPLGRTRRTREGHRSAGALASQAPRRRSLRSSARTTEGPPGSSPAWRASFESTTAST